MFHRMTDTEIAIRRIENLRMVAVYEFTEAVRRKEGNAHGTDPDRDGCTAVTVLYGDDEQISMSELDPYYETLVGRLFELYQKSKNPSAILMNEKTRELFESGQYTEEAHFQREFARKTGSVTPEVPMESLDLKRFLPLAEYVLTSACELTGNKATVVKTHCGWRGRGSIVLNKGGSDTLHPVTVTRDGGGEYRIHIGDWPETADELRIDFKSDIDSVDLAFSAVKAQLTGRFRFRRAADGFDATYEASRKGSQVYYNRETIPAEPFERIADDGMRRLLPVGVAFSEAYRLPWGLWYAVSTEVSRYRDVIKKDFCSAFLYCEAGYSEVMSWTIADNAKTNAVIRKNSVRMKRALLRDGRCETYFEPDIAGASGIYKTELAGKYFLSE